MEREELENPGTPWGWIAFIAVSLAFHAAGFAALSGYGKPAGQEAFAGPRAVMVSLVSPHAPGAALSAAPSAPAPAAPKAAPASPKPAAKPKPAALQPMLAEKKPVAPPEKPAPEKEQARPAPDEPLAGTASQASPSSPAESSAGAGAETSGLPVAGEEGPSGPGEGPLYASLGSSGLAGRHPAPLPREVTEALEESEPAYPRRARKLGIEGRVEVEMLVSTSGIVTGARVLSASPRGLFEESALACVRTWKFPVYSRNGIAIEYTTVRVVSFQLK
ncbi:MAG: TonB family protein [Thermodesulfobacteriota bacterium]